MNIVHVIARLNIGGPAVHVGLACSGLRAMGHGTTLVAGRVVPPEGDMAYACTDRGVEPIYVDTLGRSLNPVGDAAAVVALVRLFRRLRPDVVHTHTSKAGAIGRLAARIARVPAVVHTFHGHVFTGYFGRATSFAVRAVEKTLALMTDRVVVLTAGQRQELVAHGICAEDRIEVVPFGMDLRPMLQAAGLRSTARAELELRPDSLAIGIAGRLTAIKGHTHFFEMARELAVVEPRAVFLVAGDGELRDELEELVHRMGLSDRTRFLGWRQEMLPFYAALDALTLTSLNEGSPVVLKEAMAAGVPCVAHSVGGVPDLITDGENGYLAAEGDTAGLVRQVRRALCPGAERDALVERARARALADYGLRPMLERLESVYEKALAK